MEISENICSLCGSNHNIDKCSDFPITNYVSNKIFPSKARSSLPDGLIIETLADGTDRIKSKINIQKGTRFGPLEAVKTLTLNPAVQFPIKLFPYGEEEYLEHYLDTTSEQQCTWMMFVEPADHYNEQNLACYQDKRNIYFIVTKNIEINDCLKVWYAPYYAKMMEKKLLTLDNCNMVQNFINNNNNNNNELVESQQNLLVRENWTCKFCGKIETEITNFTKHILKHYNDELLRTCDQCKSVFVSKKRLLRHKNIVHDIPYRTKMSIDCYPELEKDIEEMPIGGPLLNNLEFNDNSNLLVPTSSQIDEDLHIMNTEHLNMENILTENVQPLDHFNFDFGENNKTEFVCDVCFKSFANLRRLIVHLKLHTGEYVCIDCKKIFCRKENLKYHSCNGVKFKCEFCDRVFHQRKFLKRHIQTVHEKKFKCVKCNVSYSSKYQLEQHHSRVHLKEERKYFCSHCKKSFMWKSNLRKHVYRKHNSNIESKIMCEFCTKQFASKDYYKTHLKTHKEPGFQCQICDKKFNRKDVWQGHVELHYNQEMKCSECDKRFNSKKTLKYHLKSHSEETSFNCEICNSTLKTKISLEKHYKSHRKNQDNKELLHCCPYCQKRVKLKSSLVRHINNLHSEHKNKKLPSVETKKISSAEIKIVNLSNDDVEIDSLANSKDNIDLIKELESNLQIEMIDKLILSTTKKMGIEINDGLLNFDNMNVNTCERPFNDDNDEVENKEIYLSMPDLSEQDHDVTDNHLRTIMESSHNSDVVVYVLNQQS